MHIKDSNVIYMDYKVFEFADKHRGSYNNSTVGPFVCPFYCDYNGYQVILMNFIIV